jgi:hypothetical protein
VSGLDAAGVLRAWEVGRRQAPAERALTLLRLATGRARDELARLPIPARDRLLLDVRAATFGRHMEARVACGACGDELTFELDGPTGVDRPEAGPSHRAVHGSETVEFRLPTSDDLLAASGAADVHEARAVLGRRCVVALVGLDEVPDRLPDWIADELSLALADDAMSVALTCPACGHQWTDAVDIGAFLWAEVDADARRLMREVAVLARAFGWQEADILAMSAARRRGYLELAP